MLVLMEFPLTNADSSSTIVVETERGEIPDGLILASPHPGEVAARAARSVTESLEQLEPLLRTLKQKLSAAGPDDVTVEFGIKLGGETGLILAKGTAEVNFKVSVSWKSSGRPEVSNGAI